MGLGLYMQPWRVEFAPLVVRSPTMPNYRPDAALDQEAASAPTERTLTLSNACGAVTITGVACDQPNSHVDCGYGFDCRDGLAWNTRLAPVPTPNLCSSLSTPPLDYSRICCESAVRCAQGCAHDRGARTNDLLDLMRSSSFDWRALPPSVLCEEFPYWSNDAGIPHSDGSPPNS